MSLINLPSPVPPSRRISRSVTLRNKTCLPVSWRLQGVEELGDEFSVPQEQGVVPANSSYPLSLHFRTKKPLQIKKTLRLEVRSSTGMHSENSDKFRSGHAYTILIHFRTRMSLRRADASTKAQQSLEIKSPNCTKHDSFNQNS